MDSSEDAARRLPSKTQLQGPRPPPLTIHKDSHKIKKPPKPPAHDHHHHSRQQPPTQPVIIYAVSPKIIHATVAEFMTTVQRLTGVSSDAFSGSGDVSPAARLASLEKVSPKEKGPSSNITSIDLVDEEGVEGGGRETVGRVPGILSPATLPPVVQEMYFSPATDLNPFNSIFHGSGGFLTSPSGLFSTAIGSPVLSPDIFGQIWNF